MIIIFQKKYLLHIQSVKNNILVQDIIVEEGELTKIMIAGGLGINYK